jgi:hypothetical protein
VRPSSGIQGSKLNLQTRRMLRLYASLGSRPEEQLNAFVTKLWIMGIV